MKTILVVDDNAQNLYMLEVLLKNNNYLVESAENGQEALKIALEFPPDLVISDILMPVMDGFTLCRLWKIHPQLKRIPFVFYTATYTDQKDEEYALGLGADKFIVKPMEPSLFIHQVLEVLDQTEAGAISVQEPVEMDEEEGYKLYSGRLVQKLEKKMLELEEEIRLRTQTEQELRTSRREWQQIFQAIGNPAFVMDPDYTIINANSAAAHVFGTTEEQLVGRTCHSLFHGAPDLHELCSMMAPRHTCDGAVELSTIEALEGDFLLTCTPVLDSDGQVEKIIHIAADISEQKKTERALVESEERFRQLVENIREVFWIRDAATSQILYMSPMYDTVFGLSRDDLARDPYAFLHVVVDEDEQVVREAQTRQLTGGQLTETIFRIRRPGGELRWLRSRTFPVSDEEGGGLRIAGVIEDITEAKEAEEERLNLEKQLHQSQKLEAIGTLSGGIAHDFNNILTSILGYTQLSLAEIPKETQLRQNIIEILTAARRAKELVKQILAFTRQSTSGNGPVQLALLIEETVKLLRSSLPTTITIHQDLHDRTSYIMGDATKIHQVLVNLCTNAAHAMVDQHGTLCVTLCQVCLNEQQVREQLDIPPGDYMKLTVEDTGVGIPSDMVPKIFDPFFTTKKPDQGVGLGLSVVHGIIKSHEGHISVTSEVGKGSVFTVYIPVCSAPESEQPETGDRNLAGSESILFVDDEVSIGTIFQKRLERLGYTVTSFSNPEEAFEIFRQDLDRFDLVITDMTMPQMTGDQLSRSILKIKPEMPIILCTGFSQKVPQEMVQDIGIKGMLLKPVSLTELCQMIRRALDESAAPLPPKENGALASPPSPPFRS